MLLKEECSMVTRSLQDSMTMRNLRQACTTSGVALLSSPPAITLSLVQQKGLR